MKFPLSLDLRSKTLADAITGVAVIDADQNRIMLILPDEKTGTYDRAGVIVDALNAVGHLLQEAAKL